jgi:hypothetical protein
LTESNSIQEFYLVKKTHYNVKKELFAKPLATIHPLMKEKQVS